MIYYIIFNLFSGQIVASSGGKALKVLVPPGSVFKLVTALSIPIPPDYTYTCTTKFKYNLPCSLHSGHGVVDLRKAIGLSCNHYFFNLSLHYPSQYIYRFLNRIGFLEKSSWGDITPPMVSIPKTQPKKAWAFIGNVETIRFNLYHFVPILALIASGRYALYPSGYKRYVWINRDKLKAVRKGMLLAVKKGTANYLSRLSIGYKVYAKTGTNSWHQAHLVGFISDLNVGFIFRGKIKTTSSELVKKAYHILKRYMDKQVSNY